MEPRQQAQWIEQDVVTPRVAEHYIAVTVPGRIQESHHTIFIALGILKVQDSFTAERDFQRGLIRNLCPQAKFPAKLTNNVQVVGHAQRLGNSDEKRPECPEWAQNQI